MVGCGGGRCCEQIHSKVNTEYMFIVETHSPPPISALLQMGFIGIHEIIQQCICIVIFHLTTYRIHAFVHFSQHIIGGIGPDFDQSMFQQIFAYFFHVGFFNIVTYLLDFLSQCFVGDQTPDFFIMGGFSYTERSFVYFTSDFVHDSVFLLFFGGRGGEMMQIRFFVLYLFN